MGSFSWSPCNRKPCESAIIKRPVVRSELKRHHVRKIQHFFLCSHSTSIPLATQKFPTRKLKNIKVKMQTTLKCSHCQFYTCTHRLLEIVPGTCCKVRLLRLFKMVLCMWICILHIKLSFSGNVHFKNISLLMFVLTK